MGVILNVFSFADWLDTIISSIVVSLPIFYFIKSWAKDKKEQREHDSKERDLDRKERGKENLANMEKFFSLLYKEANKELLESFKELQKDYKNYLLELMKR